MRKKYPRTLHLPWSASVTQDDRVLVADEHFIGRDVVATEKLDGENTTIYSDGTTHARSIVSGKHPSRAWVRGLAASLRGDIPYGWRVVGENVYAVHSVEYTHLESWFYVFAIYDENDWVLSWDDTMQWAELLDLALVPVFYRGIYDPEAIQESWNGTSFFGPVSEGYVVRCANAFPASRFSSCVAKYVRPGHVQAEEHWMYQPVRRQPLAS